YYLLPFAFPIPDAISSETESSAVLLDRNGQELAHLVREDYYRHQATSLESLPQDLIQATLAAEDKRFMSHGGVDVRATARALKDAWEEERFVSGASTITQQTVKLTSGKAARTFPTKIRETLTARHVEMVHDKGTILTTYFNHLDYGNLSQGPLQAARHYFGKPLHHLSLAECALLAGLPQAPSRLNPRRNPEAAVKRRNWILDRMEIVFDIPAERIQTAKNEPLLLRRPEQHQLAPHLAQLMRHQQGQLRGNIRTTLSAALQSDVTHIVRQQIATLSEKHIQHAAVVVIDNATGEVLALVGSPDFQSGQSGQIDATRTARSPGSALKPFTYLLAFENGGMTPATIIPDVPTQFADNHGVTDFVNYDRHYRGPVTVHHALASSLNVPAIRTLNHCGGAAALQKSLAGFGITTLTEQPVHYGLGLTLGSGPVTLLELTNAYASLARMGVHRPVRFLANPTSHGEEESKKHIASYRSCWMLAQTMSNNLARSSAFGPNSHLRLPFPCAVKTGTSTDFRDNWCLGFTPEYTVGVWCGNLDNTPMRGISGVTGAGPIFHATMMRLHRDRPATWYQRPPRMIDCLVNRLTGKRHSNNGENILSLCLPVDRLPMPAAESDYDADGRVLLDSQYAGWIENESTQADHSAFALRKKNISQAQANAPLRILSPAQQAQYFLDPDIPSQGRKLDLSTDFQGAHTWSSPSLTIKGNTATLTPGNHEIHLTDATGRSTTRSIAVEEL
ncbi:MAG: penicillin-binding protein 1C, partial [Akkermansiaceae bacterium]